LQKIKSKTMSVYLLSKLFVHTQPNPFIFLVSTQACWTHALSIMQRLEHERALTMMRDLIDVIGKYDEVRDESIPVLD